MAVFYYLFYAQTRLEGKNFILLHLSKHWRLAAFSFYQGTSYWRAGDLGQGINLEWPNIIHSKCRSGILTNGRHCKSLFFDALRCALSNVLHKSLC